MQEQKKRELKSDSVKIASVEFKNRLKTAVLLFYGRGGPETELPH